MSVHVQLNGGTMSFHGANPLKRWGDRRGLNPQPPVPQTGEPHPNWRFSDVSTSRPFPSDPESLAGSTAHLFGLNRGALVSGIRRFFAKLDGTPEGACWNWTAGTGTWGYGILKVGRRTMQAHRFSYALHKGDPAGWWVLHACDNPRCCNPAHLRLGTQQDNEDDKGRTLDERLALSALPPHAYLRLSSICENAL